MQQAQEQYGISNYAILSGNLLYALREFNQQDVLNGTI